MASAERHRGFNDALAEAGLDPDAGPVEQGYFSYKSGLVAAQRLITRPRRPTATVADHDDMAPATASVAHPHGLAGPGDIRTTGYDEPTRAPSTRPESTTICRPLRA